MCHFWQSLCFAIVCSKGIQKLHPLLWAHKLVVVEIYRAWFVLGIIMMLTSYLSPNPPGCGRLFLENYRNYTVNPRKSPTPGRNMSSIYTSHTTHHHALITQLSVCVRINQITGKSSIFLLFSIFSLQKVQSRDKNNPKWPLASSCYMMVTSYEPSWAIFSAPGWAGTTPSFSKQWVGAQD